MSSYLVLTKDIKLAVQYIITGRIVAFPTGTSYGLAVDALQGHALQRLRNLKRRPTEKTFTIMLPESLWPTYLDISPAESALLQRMHHQPLTLLVKPRPSLVHLAQNNLIGLRVVDHPLMRSLTEVFQGPLTATSANQTGQSPCYSPRSIRQAFPGKLDATTYDLSLAAIIDGGILPPNPSTTIAKIVDNKVTIIRPGALRLDQL